MFFRYVVFLGVFWNSLGLAAGFSNALEGLIIDDLSFAYKYAAKVKADVRLIKPEGEENVLHVIIGEGYMEGQDEKTLGEISKVVRNDLEIIFSGFSVGGCHALRLAAQVKNLEAARALNQVKVVTFFTRLGRESSIFEESIGKKNILNYQLYGAHLRDLFWNSMGSKMSYPIGVPLYITPSESLFGKVGKTIKGTLKVTAFTAGFASLGYLMMQEMGSESQRKLIKSYRELCESIPWPFTPCRLYFSSLGSMYMGSFLFRSRETNIEPLLWALQYARENASIDGEDSVALDKIGLPPLIGSSRRGLLKVLNEYGHWAGEGVVSFLKSSFFSRKDE